MRFAATLALALTPVASAQELIWSDEFDGTSLDATKWEPMIGTGTLYGLPAGWGNNELQYYQSDSNNLFVAGGHLHIVARPEPVAGWNYTSARIRTHGLAEFLYGRIEARIQLPSGQGLWPAFWMLPTNSPYGGWAAGGEIDIMESVNTATTAHGTIHFGGTWPDNQSNGGSYDPPGSVISGFHTYAIEWDPFQIRWYFDDVHYHTANSNQWWSANGGGDEEAPFDAPFHLLLNVAVGGNWPGPPNGSTPFPAEMLVDYVRVYVDELKGPYGGTPQAIPGTIEAEDYDLGGLLQGYWDEGMTNEGGEYRPDQGVDIEVASEGGYNVGWIREGEWLEYTVDVDCAGPYAFGARVASQSTGGTFHMEIDGVDATGSIIIPSTGGWQSWTTVTALMNFDSPGEHLVRFVNDSPDSHGYNLNSFSFDFVGTPSADLDGNGSVGFTDLTLLLSLWGSSDACADLDGNGTVGFTDLTLLLGNWS